jgi:uncharacterized protein
MEQRDLELIQQLVSSDPELKQLWDAHEDLEGKLATFTSRLYLTPEEEIEKKKLQKKKLAGRDRMEGILAKYRTEKGRG